MRVDFPAVFYRVAGTRAFRRARRRSVILQHQKPLRVVGLLRAAVLDVGSPILAEEVVAQAIGFFVYGLFKLEFELFPLHGVDEALED